MIYLLQRVINMPFSYNKLWKILIDKGMKKTDLKSLCQIGPVTLAKMSKNEPVSMDVLEKICLALKCNVGDIVDFTPDGQ